MITYRGKVGIVQAFPIFGQLIGAIDVTGLTAEAAALLQASVTFTPPSIIGILGIFAAVTAAIQLGFQPPVFDFKANFLVKYGLLKARLDLILKIIGLVTSGSVRLYEQEGTAGTFGAEWTATLTGGESDGGIAPTQGTYSLLLVAEAGTSGEATLKVLRSGA